MRQNLPYLSITQNDNLNHNKQGLYTFDDQYNSNYQNIPSNLYSEDVININEYEEGYYPFHQNYHIPGEKPDNFEIAFENNFPKCTYLLNTKNIKEINQSNNGGGKQDSNQKKKKGPKNPPKKIPKKPKKIKYMQEHYIRVKVRRRFFNVHIKGELNRKIKKITPVKFSDLYYSFEKLGTKFVICVQKKSNRNLFDKTLKEIITNIDSYSIKETNEKYKYERNVLVVKKIEEIGNEDLIKFLETSYRKLFENYINSKAFLVDEIGKIKRSKIPEENKEEYIRRYKEVAKDFIEFCYRE